METYAPPHVSRETFIEFSMLRDRVDVMIAVQILLGIVPLNAFYWEYRIGYYLCSLCVVILLRLSIMARDITRKYRTGFDNICTAMVVMSWIVLAGSIGIAIYQSTEVAKILKCEAERNLENLRYSVGVKSRSTFRDSTIQDLSYQTCGDPLVIMGPFLFAVIVYPIFGAIHLILHSIAMSAPYQLSRKVLDGVIVRDSQGSFVFYKPSSVVAPATAPELNVENYPGSGKIAPLFEMPPPEYENSSSSTRHLNS